MLTSFCVGLVSNGNNNIFRKLLVVAHSTSFMGEHEQSNRTVPVLRRGDLHVPAADGQVAIVFGDGSNHTHRSWYSIPTGLLARKCRCRQPQRYCQIRLALANASQHHIDWLLSGQRCSRFIYNDQQWARLPLMTSPPTLPQRRAPREGVPAPRRRRGPPLAVAPARQEPLRTAAPTILTRPIYLVTCWSRISASSLPYRERPADQKWDNFSYLICR